MTVGRMGQRVLVLLALLALLAGGAFWAFRHVSLRDFFNDGLRHSLGYVGTATLGCPAEQSSAVMGNIHALL